VFTSANALGGGLRVREVADFGANIRHLRFDGAGPTNFLPPLAGERHVAICFLSRSAFLLAAGQQYDGLITVDGGSSHLATPMG